VVGEVAGDRQRGFDALRIRPQRRIGRHEVFPPARGREPAPEGDLFSREAAVQVGLVRLLERHLAREVADAHPDDLFGRQSPTPCEDRVHALISVVSSHDVDRIR
jgi:hypothetical protein